MKGTGTAKQKEDLIESFKLLDFYINGFEKGEIRLYRPMSVELYKLLCDGNSPLVVSVFGEVKLPELYLTTLLREMPSLKDKIVHFMPGELSNINTKVPLFNLVFHQNVKLIEINDWLNQIFFKEGVTIRELIKSVRNKVAAHSDPSYDDLLNYTREVRYGTEESQILGIYSISKLIFDIFKDANKKNNIL